MFPRLLPVTRNLLIANGVAYLLQLVLSPVLELWLALWPVGHGFMPWQLLTYGFLHDTSGLTHLLFNMLALYMFGSSLEQTWGPKRFLTYFLVCIVGAGLLQLIVGWWMVSGGALPYATVGASGGVFGLLLGYGMLFPNQRMIVFPLPMEIKARTLVIFYAVLALVLGFSSSSAFSPGRWRSAASAPSGLARDNAKGRRNSCGSDSGSTKAPKARLASASTAAAQNGARLSISARKPPSIGPATNPTPKAAPIRPKRRARSSGAEISAT